MKQITTNKIVGEQQQQQQQKQEESRKDRREGKGRVLAISRRIYRLSNSDVYYVESESSDNVYYYVKYNFSGFKWCSCPDNSTRGLKCKHQFAIEYSIRLGTLKDIDMLSSDAKRYYSSSSSTAAKPAIIPTIPKSYKDDDYTF